MRGGPEVAGVGAAFKAVMSVVDDFSTKNLKTELNSLNHSSVYF